MSDTISVVKALIRNDDGKFLVLQKADRYDHMGGKWELPGGEIEAEDRFAAARREVQEETGVTVANGEDVVRVEVESEECVNCFIVYYTVSDPDVVLSEEHQGYRWVVPDEFRVMDWHADAGYALPAMAYLEKYLSEDKHYT